MISQEEFNIIASGIDKANNDMHEKRINAAPRCHFRPMFIETSDSVEGYYEEWWECSVCCHTKTIQRKSNRKIKKT